MRSLPLLFREAFPQTVVYCSHHGCRAACTPSHHISRTVQIDQVLHFPDCHFVPHQTVCNLFILFRMEWSGETEELKNWSCHWFSRSSAQKRHWTSIKRCKLKVVEAGRRHLIHDTSHSCSCLCLFYFIRWVFNSSRTIVMVMFLASKLWWEISSASDWRLTMNKDIFWTSVFTVPEFNS